MEEKSIDLDLKNLQEIIERIDETEREFKSLNNSYQNLQNIIEQIIEFLPNAIWVINNDGTIFLQNNKAKELGNIYLSLDDSQDDIEVEHDGKSYLLQASRQSERLIVSATDITDEKRKERLASMGQVAAHLAHEIRNPIGSVALLSSTLLKKVEEPLKDIVLEIKKSIWRVERIIKATLLFSKGVAVNKKEFALERLKTDLKSAISQYTYSKDIEFRFLFPSQKIFADEDLLLLVFQNFAFNAIDAIEEEDTIESGLVEFIFLENSIEYIFEVYDNGKPIENKNILFEPFKSTKIKGNGLGLALSLQIIEAHSGSIGLKNCDRKCFEIKLFKD